jgi:hypothetical protein
MGKIEINKDSIIKRLELTEDDVLNIVMEWYTQNCNEIFQNAFGDDLEEYLEQYLEIQSNKTI